MNKEFIDKWIDALIGNKYIQGNGRLQTQDGGFCCLGVACDLFDNTKWKEYTVDAEKTIRYDISGQSEGYYLPDVIRDHIGISEKDERQLAKENDRGATFAEIAEMLKKMRDEN